MLLLELKFVRSTSNLEEFKSSRAKIIHEIMKHGGTKGRIKQYLYEIYRRNFKVIRWFSPTSVVFLKLLL